MTTCQNVIDRATSLLRVRTAGTTFSTDDANKNTEVFNVLVDMVAEWAERGIVPIPAPSSVSDTLDVSPGSIRALVYNLCIDAASLFGKNPDASIVAIAQETKDQLEAGISLDINVDMTGMPGLVSTYNIRTDS